MPRHEPGRNQGQEPAHESGRERGHDSPELTWSGMGVVAFLYGTAGSEAMSARLLLRLLGDLGLTPGAARSAVARHRRAGALTAEHRGRATTYRLSGAYLARFRRTSTADEPRGLPWDGHFHCLLVEVPEEHRWWRDVLRRECYAWGYGQLHPGVWAHVADHAQEVLAGVPAPPPSSSVVPGRVALDPVEMRARAAAMWELAERSARYRRYAAAMRAVTLPSEALEPEDLRRYVRGYVPFLQFLVHDPHLPDELVPADWGRPEAMAALTDGMATWIPALRRYFAEAEG